jgi:hypothetical protein
MEEKYFFLIPEEEAQIEREEYEFTHYTCPICHGEFWDGGTTCTCCGPPNDLD